MIGRGNVWVFRSIQLCTTSVAAKMQNAGSTPSSWNFSAKITNSEAVANSKTSGSMRRPQLPHRLGGATEPPCGTRSATTVRSDPISKPMRAAIGTSSPRLITTPPRRSRQTTTSGPRWPQRENSEPDPMLRRPSIQTHPTSTSPTSTSPTSTSPTSTSPTAGPPCLSRSRRCPCSLLKRRSDGLFVARRSREG